VMKAFTATETLSGSVDEGTAEEVT
jgi:hypothetical protein